MAKDLFKLTDAQRNQRIAAVDVLVRSIDEGKWSYSKSKLRSDFQGYRFHTWTELNPGITGILVVVGLFLGLFPAIGFIISINVAKAGRERYEQHLSQFKDGKQAA